MTLHDVGIGLEAFLPAVIDDELRVKLEAVKDGAFDTAAEAGGSGEGVGEKSLADLINGGGVVDEEIGDGDGDDGATKKRKSGDKKVKSEKKKKKKKQSAE